MGGGAAAGGRARGRAGGRARLCAAGARIQTGLGAPRAPGARPLGGAPRARGGGGGGGARRERGVTGREKGGSRVSRRRGRAGARRGERRSLRCPPQGAARARAAGAHGKGGPAWRADKCGGAWGRGQAGPAERRACAVTVRGIAGPLVCWRRCRRSRGARDRPRLGRAAGGARGNARARAADGRARAAPARPRAAGQGGQSSRRAAPPKKAARRATPRCVFFEFGKRKAGPRAAAARPARGRPPAQAARRGARAGAPPISVLAGELRRRAGGSRRGAGAPASRERGGRGRNGPRA
jgi:hypothetical protein